MVWKYLRVCSLTISQNWKSKDKHQIRSRVVQQTIQHPTFYPHSYQSGRRLPGRPSRAFTTYHIYAVRSNQSSFKKNKNKNKNKLAAANTLRSEKEGNYWMIFNILLLITSEHVLLHAVGLHSASLPIPHPINTHQGQAWGSETGSKWPSSAVLLHPLEPTPSDSEPVSPPWQIATVANQG